MDILVVSGFLGVGKTTFIKEMIKRSNKKFVVLENEYGEVNLDSQEMRQVSEMEIFEMTEGCVCCTMKDSFANSIMAISGSLDPDYLIVEPTGIGKLSNIIENLRKIEYERIRLVGAIAIIAPNSLLRLEKEYKDIYLDQLKNASHVIFSKCENEESAFFDKVESQVREQNSHAEIYKGHYKDLPDIWWDEVWGEDSLKEEIHRQEEEEVNFDRLTLYKGKVNQVGEMVFFLEELLRGKYGNIVRAKGIIACRDGQLRFDVADRLYGIIDGGEYEEKTQCVFIGNPIDKKALAKALHGRLQVAGKRALLSAKKKED
ncbi:MAG TPA: GTP-binding protein [Lachnospiraceae bacterium]